MLAVQNSTIAPAIITSIMENQETQWHEVFDRREALLAVQAHIAALPSSATPEKYTKKSYESAIKFFIEWAGDELPTKQLITGYIAVLKLGIQADGSYGKTRKSATISSKYLAPLRLYLRELSDQHVKRGLVDRETIDDWRRHIAQASKVKNPAPDTKTSIAKLWSEGNRLEVNQVNACLRRVSQSTLAGKRDYAILLIAFESALRIAELSRITLNTISTSGDKYLITVRGKRSNFTPVPISAKAYQALIDYVEAFNDRFEDVNDPRRIVGDIPVWQPVTKGDTVLPIGNYNPNKGISRQNLSEMIGKRTKDILGGQGLAAHDTRRTAASMAYDAGMPITDIQQLLRHTDPAITMRYVGVKPNFAERSLSTYVQLG